MRYLVFVVLLLSLGCVTDPDSRNTGRRPSFEPSRGLMMTPPQNPPALVLSEAPDFTAKAVMPDNTIEFLTLSSYRGKYVLLFFYPMDFTFVCPTEIIAFDKSLEAFRENNCEIIGVSTDSEYTHLAWKSVTPKEGGIGQIRYPIVADITKNIARSYGVLYNNSVALRGLFLIDPRGTIRHALINDLALGRNVDEAMRALRAVQVIDKYGAVCPANWKPGEKTLKPTNEDTKEYLSGQDR
jgi:peroxiredoxin (alkyl hydroperoxide reductase subunit C)